MSKTTTPSSSIDRRSPPQQQQQRTQVKKQVSPPIKSAMEGDMKPPSEEFMRWCRQSLRGLNRGVNGKNNVLL